MARKSEQATQSTKITAFVAPRDVITGLNTNDRLHRLAYPTTDVVALCFSAADRGSFRSVKDQVYSRYIGFVFSSSVLTLVLVVSRNRPFPTHHPDTTPGDEIGPSQFKHPVRIGVLSGVGLSSNSSHIAGRGSRPHERSQSSCICRVLLQERYGKRV